MTQAGSYGAPFNAAGGGWYAMQRARGRGVRVWFWGRNDQGVPVEVRAGAGLVESVEGWGMPGAEFAMGGGADEQDEEEEESGAEVGVGMGVRAKWKRNDDGESASGAEGTCGFDEHFDDHVAVFDLTFCVSAPFCVPRLICVANGEADDVMDGRIILG